ncbi:MAG: hypothetical protein RI947_517 [Candidatus Parcubacteria bacterium]
MLYTIVYITVILGELVFSIFACFYIFSLIYSSLMGSPYVPTKNKVLKDILDRAKLKKGDLFIDLGCGDGRIVRMAATHYNVEAIGIDINPSLIWLSRLKTKLKKIRNTTFHVQNIYKSDISNADVVYLFLLPKFLVNLQNKLLKETKKGALIISHGFRIDGWDQYLVDTIVAKPFPTYYYRLKPKG